MKFKKTELQDLLYDECKPEWGRVVEDSIYDTSRWSIYHEMIFEHDGKFYQTTYSVGATEYQSESPFEYEPDEIECTEVAQVEKVVKVWEVVK